MVREDVRQPGNPKNQFDYVGEIHIEIEAVYMSKYGRESRPTKEICDIVGKLSLENKDFQKLIENVDYPGIDCEILDKGKEDFSNQYENFINSLNLTQKVKIKIQELVDFMFELGLKTEEPSYDELYNYVVSFEDEVMNDGGYSEKDLLDLLCSTSTARFSCFFWKNELNGSAIKTSKAQKRKWWQWLIIGVSDVVGGIAGASVGGPAAPATAVSTGVATSSLATTLSNPKNK